MEKQGIIARLRENKAALKARGVVHAASFMPRCSVRARGDARPVWDALEDNPEDAANLTCACKS